MKTICKIFALSLLASVLTGCIATPAGGQTRRLIALIAPFEGRCREVGYQAFYAVQMAIAESGAGNRVTLLAQDSGGRSETVNRARAIVRDRRVIAVIVLGEAAARPDVLSAFANVPTLIVGSWGVTIPAEADRYPLSERPLVEDEATIESLAVRDAPFVSDERVLSPCFSDLRDSVAGVSGISLATLPDADFIERYQEQSPFAPPPGIIASLTYEAAVIAVGAIGGDTTREAVSAAIAPVYEEWMRARQPIRYEYTGSRQLVTQQVIE